MPIPRTMGTYCAKYSGIKDLIVVQIRLIWLQKNKQNKNYNDKKF